MAFQDVLDQLGDELGIDIIPDLHGTCLLLINEKIKVQLEIDVTGETLLMASLLLELPPGRFRENVLKDALKANHAIEENYGSLSYTGSDNSLVLSNQLPMHGLTGKELYAHLAVFVQRATNWVNAIDEGLSSPRGTGEIPQAEGQSKTNIFGFQE